MASAPPSGEREAEEKREQGKEEEDEDINEEEAPSHLPLAPPSELYDTSTTVDPSYVISLIRKLLPQELAKQSQKIEKHINSMQGSDKCSLENGLTKDCNGMREMMAAEALESCDSFRNVADGHGDKDDGLCNDKKASCDSILDHGMGQEFGKEEITDGSDDGKTDVSNKTDVWEDCGCILWDLSASVTHAEFMVDNLVLEVLLENLHISKSVRITEICMGIIGNLACHHVLSSKLVSTNGLLDTVVQQLFLDDSACLSELFRLFTAGLQGSTFASWTEALLPEQVLLRILWIIGNTLNSLLLEKSIEFLVTIINNQELASILLQPLIKLGLPNLVATLLAGEIGKIQDGKNLERSSVNGLILDLVEALSTSDSYSQAIISNQDVFTLVCTMVKLPDKTEVENSCISAVIIIANLLADEQNLLSELSQNFSFLQGLLDILPFVSDDPQARNALWCIVARLLGHVLENDISITNLHEFASVFIGKSHLIEEDTADHPMGDDNHDAHNSYTTTSLRMIACILEKWIAAKTAITEKDVAGNDNDGKLQRLLSCCHKYVSSL